MAPDVEIALRLQGIDQRISALSKEISALPKYIADIERKLGVHERRLDVDRAALSANQKERKRLEGEIQTSEAKISKLRGQMLEAKNNDQYRAFQNEIEFCEREIRSAEDRILDLMAEGESLDKNVKTAEGTLKEERVVVEAEKARTQKRTAEDRQMVAQLEGQRKQEIGAMSPQMAATYERIRKARGIVVSEAQDGRCAQCHLGLRPQLFQELKRAEKPTFCENCGRILRWNPPRSAEDIAGVNALSDVNR